MSTSADAELVPQGFYDQIQEILRYTGPAFQPGLYTILNTATGNDIKVPRQTAFSAATATAEGAQFAVSNPTGESFTLKSQKVGVLLKVSSELITDNEVNLVEYLGRQAGEAVGYKVNELLAVGTGTVQPQGIFGAAASGVVGTAAGGTFTADNLIAFTNAANPVYNSNFEDPYETVMDFDRAVRSHERAIPELPGGACIRGGIWEPSRHGRFDGRHPDVPGLAEIHDGSRLQTSDS